MQKKEKEKSSVGSKGENSLSDPLKLSPFVLDDYDYEIKCLL